MERSSLIFFAVILFAVLTSCTSGRWTVKEKTAIDKNEYNVLRQKRFLAPAGEVSRENPVLKLDLYSRVTYKYAQRVLMQRNIQDYKLRPGFLAMGLGGAAMAFYLANSETFRGNGSSTKSVTLNAAGALLAISGFMNMKPVGDPRPTGEERFLRKSGTATRIDTVKSSEDVQPITSIGVKHNGKLIFEGKNRDFTGGTLEIPLAGKLNDLQLSGLDPGSVTVEVSFEDSTYSFQYPVKNILRPYARITSQFTELRNSPRETPDNVLADLVEGSQLQIKSAKNPQWYRVLYGISENYIRKEDADLIWRSTDFATDEQVVTVPRISFGNVDVESNIPILRGPRPNAIALIVTNENYSNGLAQRNYAHRDGRMIASYLNNALGYKQENIHELKDISDTNEIYRKLSEIRLAANDSTELFVYLSGHGTVDAYRDRTRLGLLGITNEAGRQFSIPLSKLFEQISTISSAKILVLSDIDFNPDKKEKQFSANKGQRIIEANAAPLLKDNPKATLLMGNQLSYPSSLYFSSAGVDKKHHIFPYFFAKALQKRKTNIAAIYQYLERNVSYTARKLYDRPQDPLLLGRVTFDFANQ